MRANTKKFKVLLAIGSSPKGLRFSQIQRFACMLNGHDFDEFVVEDAFIRYDSEKRESVFAPRRKRRWRGFWCTNLQYAGKGILPECCVKVDGRWMLTQATVHEMTAALCKDFLRDIHFVKFSEATNV
jgi:hypothetical protein